MICCQHIQLTSKLTYNRGHVIVRCMPTDEWKADQQFKRAAYENGRHNHQQENPHITRDEIIAAEELKMALDKVT